MNWHPKKGSVSGLTRPRPPLLPAAATLGLIALLGVSCQSDSRFRGLPAQDLIPRTSPTAFLRDDYEHKILVAVGIDAYAHADRLRHAVSDARAVTALFKSLGFETRELYNAEATQAQVTDVLGSTARQAGPNDLVVFFFAGHGIDVKHNDGSVKGYLVPVGGQTRDPGTLIPMDWLQVDLVADKTVKAKHLLFLLDACSSGIVAARSSVSIDSSVRDYISELLKRQARQVITAGTGSQQVLDGGYKGHSIFAGLIIQGIEDNFADLNNDYHVTATELGLFLSQKVYIESNGAQKPDFAKLLGTRGGEVILRFPSDREKQILAERRRSADIAEPDLLLDISPVAADVLVYDANNTLAAEVDKVRGRVRIQSLRPGDYQVVIRSRDSRYESILMVMGVYGPVAKEVTLPKRLYNVSSVPLL